MSRVEANKQIPESDFGIIGEGEIGDKAKQLIDKTPFLRSIGFRTPHRTVLAQGFFDSFFQRNRLGKSLTEADPVPDLEARIENGSFPAEDINTLQRVITRYDSSPLIIRSSGQGDARGTGIYKSVITEGTMQESKKALLEVLASYFSPSAVAFRYDAHTGEGFGIMIEPLIGQDFGDCFCPSLSGYGYSSTPRGEGYINVVPGLGGGVDSREGERLTAEKVSPHNGLLGLYVLSQRDEMLFHSLKTIRRSALLRTDQRMPSREEYNALAYFPRTPFRKSSRISPTYIEFEEDRREALENINLLPLFTMIKRMEETDLKPQYFEWAVTLEGEIPTWWITQIAGVDKKVDMVEFNAFGEIMFMANNVTGTGVKDCSKIAECWNPDDVPLLNGFNKTNTNYILLYSSRLTTGGTGIEMKYKDFNNASVFLEIDDAGHLDNPVAHLGGSLELAGKLFGVLDYEAETPPDFERFSNGEKEENGLRVYQGNTKVVVSEKQNRMVVYAVD